MIAAFLLPFPLRGYRAPYLWVYYRLLSSFGERMLFVASEDYTRAPEYWQAQNRWEMQPGNAQRLHYQELTIKSTFHHTPESVRKAFRLIADGHVDPNAFISGEAPLDHLPEVLRRMAGGGDGLKTAILTWGRE